MGGSELYFIIALIVGFGIVIGRDRWRDRRHLAAAARQGLLPGGAGLTGLPASFQNTVLFLVGDGGHERQVSEGTMSLADAPADAEKGSPGGQNSAKDASAFDVTVFDFAFQRDVRGEWGYLDSKPPFRIFSPLTVAAFELPTAVEHLLIKRRGEAEVVGEQGADRYRSLVDIARDMSTIERAIAVEPPATLPDEPERIDGLAADYLVWAQNAETARAILDREFVDYLRAPALAGRELVIETLGPLLLVYCAKDGALRRDDADRFVTQAMHICRALWTRFQAVARDGAR